MPTRFDSWSVGPIGGTTAGCRTQDGLVRMYCVLCVSTPPYELVGGALCRWYCLGRRAPYMSSPLQLYFVLSAPNVRPVTCYIPWRPPRVGSRHIPDQSQDHLVPALAILHPSSSSRTSPFDWSATRMKRRGMDEQHMATICMHSLVQT